MGEDEHKLDSRPVEENRIPARCPRSFRLTAILLLCAGVALGIQTGFRTYKLARYLGPGHQAYSLGSSPEANAWARRIDDEWVTWIAREGGVPGEALARRIMAARRDTLLMGSEYLVLDVKESVIGRGWSYSGGLLGAGLLLFLFPAARSLYYGRTGRCRECGYSLRGLATPRCPECGTPFRAQTD